MNSVNDKSTIETVLQQIAQAHAEKDAAKLASFYKSTALLFDLPPPLTRYGMNANEIATWFDTWDGPIQMSYKNVNTEISGNLAISTALLHMRGKEKDGEHIDLWFRATTCLKKYDGRWLIIHEHTSVPLHIDSSEHATLNLHS